MKKTFLRRICCFSTILMLLMSVMIVPAYAASTNGFVLWGNNGTATVNITQTMVAGTAWKDYDVVKVGSDGIINIRLENSNGSYLISFSTVSHPCSQATDALGVTIPQGTYNVSIVSRPCTVLQVTCNFHFN